MHWCKVNAKVTVAAVDIHVGHTNYIQFSIEMSRCNLTSITMHKHYELEEYVTIQRQTHEDCNTPFTLNQKPGKFLGHGETRVVAQCEKVLSKNPGLKYRDLDPGKKKKGFSRVPACVSGAPGFLRLRRETNLPRQNRSSGG